MEEAQVRYEFEGLKSSLLKQLEEQDHAHNEKIYQMEQVRDFTLYLETFLYGSATMLRIHL